MKTMLDQYLQELRCLNREIRRQLELAEVRVDTVNAKLADVARLGLLCDRMILGRTFQRRSAALRSNDCGERLVQPCLSTKNGYGAVFWDFDEYHAYAGSTHFEFQASRRCLPFCSCGAEVKAILLPHLEPLLDQFLRSLAGSRPKAKF